MKIFGFKKSERMVSEKTIGQLFSSGSRSLSVYPVKIVYRQTPETDGWVTVLISVSKRHFRHAVDRNRAKRQMREAYRLNKAILSDAVSKANKHTDLALIWMSDELQSSETVHKSVSNLLQLLSERL